MGASNAFSSCHCSLPAVFLISFSAVGWQLGLMRCLLISRYDHFSFLVISCALLGFGASGTLLLVFRDALRGREESVFQWGVIFFGASIPVCYRVGEVLPLSVYFPSYALCASLGWWFVFWLLHLIPFVLAGALIGIALIMEKERVHRTYAASLAGSGAGTLGAILLMKCAAANALAASFGLVALAAAVFCGSPSRGGSVRLRRVTAAGLAICLAAAIAAGPDGMFPESVDEFKTLAYVRRLMEQGSAETLSTLHGPRGRIDLVSSAHFHSLLSFSSHEPPPRMDIILRDGIQAGAIPLLKAPEDAKFLHSTLTALPYRFVDPERVLILGEDGALYVWAARLSRAKSIVLVQSDENVLRILRDHQSRPLDDPRIQVVIAGPRAFLDSNRGEFEVIHLACLEGFAAGSGGIGGLRENYLATVEGFAECLRALSPRGLACAARGIQDPPRDNIRIAATWIEALERSGLSAPGDCLLMARDELVCASFAAKGPIDKTVAAQFAATAQTMGWDCEWFPGVKAESTNKVHALPGPPGTAVSWYQYALQSLLSASREDFYRSWICHVRPATDDRPFFFDFFRWASISILWDAFGPHWAARSEMGFLALVLGFAWSVIVAAILLLLPLLLHKWNQTNNHRRGYAASTGYFAALGLAFMFVEMCFIQLFTRFLGDPLHAAALVVGGLLVFAGMGSIVQPTLTRIVPRGLLGVMIGLSGLVAAQSLLLPPLFKQAAMLPELAKVLLALAALAPVGVLMGAPFPWGLAALNDSSGRKAAFAWAVNGFASVAASSLAVILAMTYGFGALLGLAGGLYLTAGVLSAALRCGGEARN
jgi:hypothetical protein